VPFYFLRLLTYLLTYFEATRWFVTVSNWTCSVAFCARKQTKQ